MRVQGRFVLHATASLSTEPAASWTLHVIGLGVSSLYPERVASRVCAAHIILSSARKVASRDQHARFVLGGRTSPQLELAFPRFLFEGSERKITVLLMAMKQLPVSLARRRSTPSSTSRCLPLSALVGVLLCANAATSTPSSPSSGRVQFAVQYIKLRPYRYGTGTGKHFLRYRCAAYTQQCQNTSAIYFLAVFNQDITDIYSLQ